MKMDPGSIRREVVLAWVMGAVLIAALFGYDLATFHQGYISNHNYWGRDFVNLWTGGRLVLEGRWSLLNDFPSFFAYQHGLFPNLEPHNYSYPPVSYPLAAAFALLPYWASLTAWVGATTALFVYACRAWWPKEAGPAWLAALTPAVVMNIWGGQYACLIGALFLLGFQWLDRHPRRAGIAFGLMLLKPHLAVLVPVALLFRRDWAALRWGAVTVAVLLAITIALFGAQSWIGLLFRTGPGLASMVDARGTFVAFLSTSTATAAMSLGMSWKAALLAQGLVATAAIGMVSIAAWKRTPTRELAFLVATCTFLVLPYAFNYDLTVVCVGALALALTPSVGPVGRLAALGGFLCAPLGMVLQVFGLPAMPVLLAGLAAAQLHHWVLAPARQKMLGNSSGGLAPAASV
jgi:alpha-1,2-mannosyltransferase